MDAFIRKPFRQDELARAIESAFARPSRSSVAA
jgi:FixJ family two-component response regulator